MSSDVQAKWMNSATRATSGTFAKRSFSQYSTALTSWFVVPLDRLDARCVLGREARGDAGERLRAAGENGGTSAIAGSAASAPSHAISMRTRWRISANSLNCSRSAPTLAA